MGSIEGGPRAWTVAAATAVLLGVAYWNGLDGAFVFDDEPSIRDNESIRSLWPPSRVLWTPGQTGRTHDGRPLVNLSFAISYALHGLWRPGLRIGNLLVHLANACLVFELARRLIVLADDAAFPVPSAAADRRSRLLAAAIAVVWAVHPLHTHVVTYIVQRAESLAATFILGSFLAAITALDRRSRGAALAAAVLGILGGLTKETSVAILPLVAAFDWAYHDRLATDTGVDRGGGGDVRPLLYVGLAVNPLVIAGIAWASGGRGMSAGFGSAPVVGYALTQCGAVWMYVGKILRPAKLVLDHGDGLASFSAAWPWLVATSAAILGVAIGFWKRPRAWFPPVASLLLLAPSSSIVPVATQTIAEHRAYLSSAALIGCGLAGAVWLGNRLAARVALSSRFAELAGAVLVVLLVAASIARTAVRNRDFDTAATLWAQNVRDCPGNPRGLTNLAGLFTLIQRHDVAARIFRDALAIPDLRAHAACGLGDSLTRLGDWAGAAAAYRRSLDSDGPPVAAQMSALVGLAACQVRLGHPEDALGTLEMLKSPRWRQAPMTPGELAKIAGRTIVCRGAAQRALGDSTRAEASIAEAIRYARDHGDATDTIARACDDMREFAAAANVWEPLAERDPSLLANLAVSLVESGRPGAAIAVFRRAVAAYPDDPRMRENLARAEAMAARKTGWRPPADQ